MLINRSVVKLRAMGELVWGDIFWKYEEVALIEVD